MSAWNLMGEKAQVMTPAASVTPTSATTRLVNITASPYALAGVNPRRCPASCTESR